MVHGTVGLLLVAVAGYWVLERAESHKGRLRSIGRLLGGLIILVSLMGVACRVWCLATGRTGYGAGGKGWYCPMGFKSAPTPPIQQ